MTDPEEARVCLLCKQEIPDGQEKCLHCVAPKPQFLPDDAGDAAYDPSVAGVGGLALAICLIVGGVVAFVALFMAGWIWPYLLFISVAGVGMLPHNLKQRRKQNEARRRLAKRRASPAYRRRQLSRRN